MRYELVELNHTPMLLSQVASCKLQQLSNNSLSRLTTPPAASQFCTSHSVNIPPSQPLMKALSKSAFLPRVFYTYVTYSQVPVPQNQKLITDF